MKNTETIFKSYQESIYQYDQQGQIDYLRAVVANVFGALEDNKKFIAAFNRAMKNCDKYVSDHNKLNIPNKNA